MVIHRVHGNIKHTWLRNHIIFQPYFSYFIFFSIRIEVFLSTFTISAFQKRIAECVVWFVLRSTVYDFRCKKITFYVRTFVY